MRRLHLATLLPIAMAIFLPASPIFAADIAAPASEPATKAATTCKPTFTHAAKASKPAKTSKQTKARTSRAIAPAVNTVCPVTGEKVNAKSMRVAIRGRQYFICCPDCEGKLRAKPDKYLQANGKPRNAK